MFVRANLVDIYLQGCVTQACEAERNWREKFQLTDWSTAGIVSNRSSGVQIPRDVCTRLKRYLYSAKCSWTLNTLLLLKQ